MWYYLKNSQQVGPISEMKLRELLSSKVIDSTTYVWTAGMAAWLPIEKIATFSNSNFTPPPNHNNPNQNSQYTGGRTMNVGKYTIDLLSSPANIDPIRPVAFREGALPLYITSTQVISNNQNVEVSMNYINMLITNIKASNLFKDVGAGLINVPLDNIQCHRVKFSAVENSRNNNGRWFLFILGWIMIPILIIYLLLKFNVDFQQRITFEFLSAQGKSMLFTSEATGRIKVGFFANSNDAMAHLSSTISAINIANIINQMIDSREILGL